MSSFRRYLAAIGGIAFVTVLLAVSIAAAEPLHVRIDRLVAAGQIGPVSPIVTDAEFLRRAYLDLTGEIPSAVSARLFLDDTSPDKRSKLVDRLLASPNFARHMANVLGVMLMERRLDKVVPGAEWQQYLQQSFAANKPYNQLAREILAADGVDPVLRPAVKFYLDREGEPNLLARDVGRIFFGRDLQCAQCHDHPIIDSYYQADYYGLFACFHRSLLFTDPKDKKVYFAEKGEGGVAFHSVFDPDAKGHTRPRLPGGLQLSEPTFAAGGEYTVKPADGVRPVPKYSRRARLAEEATSGANRAFNENIANRLWAHLIGRGLVEPVDLHHVDNPPSHPELLALLADEFVAMKFDVKALLREVALSQTYQRSIDLPEQQLSAADPGLAAQAPLLETELQRLTAAAGKSVKAVEQAQDELRVTRTSAVDLAAQADKLTAAMEEAKKAAETAQQAHAQAQSALSAKQEAASAVSEAATESERAAQKLPEDKPLADAAAKFKERALQLAAELAASAKAVADQTESANTAAQKLALAQAALAEAVEKRTAANTRVESFEAQNAGALAKNQGDRAAATQIERRLHTLKSLLAYQTALQSRDAGRAVLARLDAELENSKQALAKLAAELPGQKLAFEQAQKQHAAAVEGLSVMRQQLTLKDDVAKTVALAAAKAEVVLQKLPGDNELAQAAQTVKAQADQLAGEVSELKRAVAAREQSANLAAGTLAAAKQAFDSTTAELPNLETRITSLETQRQAAALKLREDQGSLSRAAEELTQYEMRQFVTASLKPLSPEQLAWSVMQAVGLSEQLRAAAEAEINAKAPLTDAIRNDPAQMAARAQQIDDATYAKLQANAARFVELFGTGAGQPQTFFATADQALFFANDGQIRGWLAPGGGNLAERLSKLTDPPALAEELYLSVLSRRPSDAEVAETTNYLSLRAGDRSAAVQELAWALIASLEFRFNH
jgi:hypothetical protein